MKKLIVLSLLFIFFGTFQVIKATPVAVAYEFEVVDGYGYDLETGIYEENVVLSSTTKMVINSANIGYELNLISLNFHHLLFFDEYNRYIGYINGNNSTYENEKHLGYDATAITNYPLNTHSFTFVNYNYENIRDQIAVTNPTIDDVAYYTLSYRDIFGNSLYGVSTNNLIENGDFELNINNWESDSPNTFTWNAGVASVEQGITNYINVNQDIEVIQNHTYYSKFDFYTDTSYIKIMNYIAGIPTTLWFLDTTETLDLNIWNTVSNVKEYNDASDPIGTVVYTIYDNINQDNTVLYDNIMIYDLTAIFDPLDLGNTLPTLEEFETMLAFYEQYVDAPVELTYNDIFVSNNLVINGDFSDGLNGWSTSLGTGYTIVDGVLTIYGDDIVNRKYIFQDLTTVNIGDIIYHSFDYETYINNPVISFRHYLTGNVNAIYGINELDSISILYTSYESLNRLFTPDFRGDIIDSDEYIKVSNIKAFNFTSIFYSGLEPGIATFETYYSVWLDPLGDYYTAYYTAGHLLGIGISYYYEPVIPTELSVDNGIDNFLDNINMNTTAGKAGIGLIFMIIIAVLIGLLTKSRPITIISLITAFLGFTVIGWFSVWIVIVISIFLVIFALLKMKD